MDKPTPSPGTEPVWDRERLFASLRGNEGMIRRLCLTFLSEYPGQLERLRTALRQRDAPRLRMDAHRLKGTAGMLRAARVRSVAQSLENATREASLDAAAQALRHLVSELDRLCVELREFTR